MSDLLTDIEEFDVNDLELGEVMEIEEITGAPLDDIQWGSARAMLAMLFVMRRRSNPDYTFEDAKKVKLKEFSPPDSNGSAPPTKPASKPKSKRANSGSRS